MHKEINVLVGKDNQGNLSWLSDDWEKSSHKMINEYPDKYPKTTVVNVGSEPMDYDEIMTIAEDQLKDAIL